MLFYEVLLMINLRKLSLIHVQIITSMYNSGMYLLTHAPASTAVLLKRRWS